MFAPRECLGSGAFGSVYRTNHPEVVVKTFREESQLHREAALWQHLCNRCDHCTWPYFAELIHGIVLRDSGDTLYEYAKHRDSVRLHFLHVIKQLRHQIYHMHHCAGIEHRDISPFNVLCAQGKMEHQPNLADLYDEDSEDDEEADDACPPLVTIIDLTNASVPECCDIMRDAPRTGRANPCTKCPEEMLGVAPQPFASDAWALGVTIVWLATGCIHKGKHGGDHNDRLSAFANHYGLPAPECQPQRAAWEEAGFTIASAHPVIAAVRAGQDVENVCALRCSRVQWDQVRGLAAELLSFSPATRVNALHDQHRWSRLRAYFDGDVEYELCPPPDIPRHASTLICDVCRPDAGLDEVMHVLSALVDADRAHPDVLKMSEAVVRATLSAPGIRWARRPDTLNRSIHFYASHVRALAAASLDVAVTMCGAFGYGTRDLLAPNTKLPNPALIHAVRRVIWGCGAAARALDEISVL